MKIGMPKETWPDETRMALVPDGVRHLVRLGAISRITLVGALLSAGHGHDTLSVALGVAAVAPAYRSAPGQCYDDSGI